MGGKRGRKRKVYDKRNSEDWCFVCKDGGFLRVCDYKNCRKSYHPVCVFKDDSFLNNKDHWSCGWHLCFFCKTKTAKLRCFCCPTGVCGGCAYNSAFVNVNRKNQGFCEDCLKLAGRIEGIVYPDANEEKLNLDDKTSDEYLFKVYWEFIKTKEGLTLEHILAAKESMRQGINDISWHISYELEPLSESDEEFVSDFEESEDAKEVTRKGRPRGRKKKLEQSNRRNSRSNQLKFNEWCSRALFDFLAAIGKDTTQKLSPHDVSKIITGYCMEHNLFDPQKKKKVICDERLWLLLRRKSINKNSILKLLNLHFAENLELSEVEFDDSSENEDKETGNKRIANPRTGRQPDKEEVTPTRQGSCFASIVAENIKTVYLKRSVVEKFLREPETFATNILGAFVRVKSDPNDYSQNNPYQLLQVASIMSTSDPGQTIPRIFLQANFVPKDIPICELSNDDFREEELEDLRRRVNGGLSSRLTVVNLEEKAKILHEDITNHYITTELVRLRNRADWASEKGRKEEHAEYYRKFMLLMMPQEQERLRNEVPRIIPEEENVVSTHQSLPKENGMGSNVLPDPTVREKPRLPWKEQQCNPVEVSLQMTCAAPSLPAPESKYIAVTDQKQSQPGTAIPTEDHGAQVGGELGTTSETLVPLPKGQSNAAMTAPCSPAPESQYVAVTHQSQSHPETAISSEGHGAAQVGGELGNTSETVVPQPQERYDPLSPARWSLGPNPTGGQSNVVILDLESEPYVAASNDNNRAELGNMSEPIVQQKEVTVFMPEEQSQDNTPGSSNGANTQPNPELIIILSDDEEEAEPPPVIIDRTPEMLDSPIWYCESPHGIQKGPYSLSLFKEWSDKEAKLHEFKVWKSGQESKNARLLRDVLGSVFSVN